MNRNYRLDYREQFFIPDLEEEKPEMQRAMTVDEFGFLKGRAITTNIGVFPYILEDGSVQMELRLPEDVFSKETLKTLDGLICIQGHTDFVDAENAKKLCVGFAYTPKTDDLYCSNEILITDKEAISVIMDEGKKALSCGYTCDLIDEEGVWLGIAYDKIQKNIRYNHIAVGIEKGRAGDACKLTFDQSDFKKNLGILKVSSKVEEKKEKKNDKDRGDYMYEILIDGIACEVKDEQTAKIIGKRFKELEEKIKSFDEIEKEKTVFEAKLESALEDIEGLKVQLAEKEKVDHTDEIKKGVRERLAILKIAEKIGVEVKEDVDDLEVKKLIIKKIHPTSAEKIDASEDLVYIDARYDGAVESIESGLASRNTLIGDGLVDHKDEKVKELSDREKMILRLKEASKKKEKMNGSI